MSTLTGSALGEPILLIVFAVVLFIAGGIGLALGRRLAASGAAAALAETTARLDERQARLTQVEAELSAAQRSIAEWRAEAAEAHTALEAEKARAAEKLALLEDARKTLATQFEALSVQALDANGKRFLALAQETLGKFQEAAQGDLEKRGQSIAELVKPVGDALGKLETNLRDLEKQREGAYAGLSEQTRALMGLYETLRAETGNLTRALRAPQVRGRWGEIQLRRVVELAGMVSHCDFEEQVTVAAAGSSGDARLRPDLVVRLPGGKTLVVDAKAPLDAYLSAVETGEEAARRDHLVRHAQQVRAHIKALSQKAYWDQIRPSPEFVVLFLPGEHFFAAALEHDPALIEAGVEQRVILATPTTLIALLRAAAYGWQQEALAENSRQIADLGRELFKRLSDMADHFGKVGQHLERATKTYNQTVASFESRVLVTARRMKDLKVAAGDGDLPELMPVETLPRLPRGAAAPGEED